MDQQIQIPDSFNDFLRDENESEESKKEKDSLLARFESERIEWTIKISDLSKKLKNIEAIVDLQVDLYTERQRAVEYYHYLMTLLIKLNKSYKKQYAEKYDFYTTQSQIRYPNETAKTNKIMVDLSDIVFKRELLENQYKFMSDVKSTLDNLIYGIKYRVEIEQILRGGK